jgi:molecular chaperone DnaK
MAALNSAMSNGSVEEIKSKTEALQQSAYKLAEEMYKATSAQQQDAAQSTDGQQGASGSKPKTKKDDGVEDADFEVVD